MCTQRRGRDAAPDDESERRRVMYALQVTAMLLIREQQFLNQKK